MVKEFINDNGSVQVKDIRKKSKRKEFNVEGTIISAKDYTSALRQFRMRQKYSE